MAMQQAHGNFCTETANIEISSLFIVSTSPVFAKTIEELIGVSARPLNTPAAFNYIRKQKLHKGSTIDR